MIAKGIFRLICSRITGKSLMISGRVPRTKAVFTGVYSVVYWKETPDLSRLISSGIIYKKILWLGRL